MPLSSSQTSNRRNKDGSFKRPGHGQPGYERGSKLGLFDLDVYTVRDLVERTGLKYTVIHEAARSGALPSRNFKGHAGYRFIKAAVMYWLSGSHGDFDVFRWLAAEAEVDRPALEERLASA